MENRTYLVFNNNITTRMNEAETLELIQEAASEINTFSLLSPSESSKIRLITRLDNLQNDLNVSIRPFDKDANLTLIIKDKKLAFAARCSVTSRDVKIKSE